jgi:hypothetical protein
MHQQNASCASCHRLLDPVGLGFENFDAVGKFRSQENGKSVDASGEVVPSSDGHVDPELYGKYNGAAELAGRMAKSVEVKRCYVTNWFRFGYARTDTDDDACLLHGLDVRFVESGFDIKQLIAAVADTDAFYLVRAGSTP